MNPHELRIQMLSAKAELIADDSRVAKIFAAQIAQWADELSAFEPRIEEMEQEDEEYRHRLVRRVGIWKREDIELLLSQSWADQHRFLFRFVRLPIFDWLRVGILDTRFKTLKERRGGPRWT